MSNSKKKHICEIYLNYVGIRFSRKYFTEAIDDNPFPNTLEGIRRVLLAFNIRSVGIILSPEEALSIVDPFFTILPELFEGFVLVTQISDSKVTVLNELGESRQISTNDYFAAWDGSVLFPEVTEQSDEPDFLHNKIISIVESLKIPLTLTVVLLLIAIAFIWKMQQTDLLFSLFLTAVYCTGAAVSWLLLMESLDVHNQLTRKVCHSGPKISCSKVLESKQSKLFGLVGWSEIGLIYFTGSLLFFLTSPQCINILFMINTFTLAYSIWSIVYQWFIVKKWCPLCLIVQALLWVQFIIFAFNGARFRLDNITVMSITTYALCMIIPAIVLWWIIPWISKANKRNYYKRAWLRMKFEYNIFSTLLANSEICDIPESARQIIIGNKNAKNTITVITNPYCHHCASLHTRLIKFLNLQDDFRAEIVFVGEDLIKDVIQKLIYIYLVHDSLNTDLIYKEWYEKYDKIFDNYTFNMNMETVETIYQSSREWYKENRKMGTPTIFINGRLLPDGYALEDISLVHITPI